MTEELKANEERESTMKSFLEVQMKYRPLSVEPRQARRPLNRFASSALIAIIGLFVSMLSAVPAFAQIVGTSQLHVERRGHTATLLQDGKVLIVGGENLNGMVSQAEIFDPVSQTSSLAAASIAARTDHTATRLLDGRVLVIGGRGQNGPLTSTEIYEPLTAAFTAGPSMTTPRSGHTATVLSNGNVLVAGGDASGGAEIYNLATQSFSSIAANMIAARKFHSAILTSSGQVLIVGGVNAQNTVLNTAEVFDPASQSFYIPPTDMQTPRALATLKLLADGKVQVIGGDAELSMEVFDPSNGIFIAKALLPPNAALLGATLSTQSRAALFSPLVLQDPLLQGVLTPEELVLLDRADQSITELPSRNQALVAGGINSSGQILNSAKLVSSSTASVTTDKTDYAPGQIVTITGSGFQPNEQVDIYFHEFPEEYPDIFLSAVANQQGNFVTAEFAPQEIDLGRVFTLTAIAQSSGFTAQTAFKDARNWNLTFAGTGSGSVTITPSTGTVNAPVSCGGTGAAASSQTVTATCAPNITTSDNGATVTFSASPGGGSVFGGWSGQSSLSSSTCSGTTNPCSAVLGSSAALTVTFMASVATTLTLSAPSPALVPFGSVGPVTLTATLTRTSGGAAVSGATIEFKVDASSVGTAVTNASGVATISTYNPSALSVGSHSVQASFAQQTITSTTYVASTSATQTLTVNKVDPTCTVNGFTGPYDETAHGATGSCKGIDGTTVLAGLDLGASFTNVPGGTANWTFTDVTGNYNNKSGSVAIVINTAFAFNGFYLPIGGSVENGDGGSYANPVRSFKLGSTIPVKFGATWLNGGAALITGIHTLQVVKYSNATTVEGEPIDATPTDSATTGNQFRLTGTDWHFNLSTKGGFSAGTWLLRATLLDGSQHTVWIAIKK
jgi:galactose oxidase-like protein/Kelch motif protein